MRDGFSYLFCSLSHQEDIRTRKQCKYLIEQHRLQQNTLKLFSFSKQKKKKAKQKTVTHSTEVESGGKRSTWDQHSLATHLSSSSFFFIMSLLQAGIDARRAASSSACTWTQGWRETWEETAARARQSKTFINSPHPSAHPPHHYDLTSLLDNICFKKFTSDNLLLTLTPSWVPARALKEQFMYQKVLRFLNIQRWSDSRNTAELIVFWVYYCSGFRMH